MSPSKKHSLMRTVRTATKVRVVAFLSLLFLTSLTTVAVSREESSLESIYERAFREFGARHYDEALKALDEIDARQPDLADSLNLRGVVFMREGKFDEAEQALQKAISVDPHFWNARFNLAEIPFLKKDWAEARSRFEILTADQKARTQPETGQLVEYKILLTFVCQGKENLATPMLETFRLAKDSPALYYSKAALAFQRGNDDEAKECLAAAKKKFSESLNSLYAESLYEVGWMERPAGEPSATLETTATEERSDQAKAEAKANFEMSERAFQQRDFERAAKLLDLAMESDPNELAFANLQGEILMEEGKLDEAEAVFRKVLEADSKSREAQFNFAQVPFRKGEYAKARERFEILFAETPGDAKNQAKQLIKYKIFMTLLLEGKDAEAQLLMSRFKFTSDTPALYYAQAAREFKDGKTEEGNDWVASAEKIYSPAVNRIFADSFYHLGWLNRSESETRRTTSTLVQAAASPAGQSESLPTPGIATGEAVGTTGTSATNRALVATNSVPQPSPASMGVARTERSPPVATNPATSPAPKISALARAGAGAEPTDSERTPNPGRLLVTALLLAGILLFAWLVVQPFRRSLFTTQLYKTAKPLGETPTEDDQLAGNGEGKIPTGLIPSSPPRISLNLKASAPSAVETTLFSSAIAAQDMAPGHAGSTTASSDEVAESVAEASSAPVAEEKIPAATESVSLREEEVPLPAEISTASAEGGEAEIGAPVAETPAAEESAEEAPESTTHLIGAPAGEPIEIGEESTVPELAAATDGASEEAFFLEREPVGQGQPVPELTTALSPDPFISELAQPEPESDLVLIEPEDAVAVPIAGHETVQPSIETPSFVSKILVSEPIQPQPATAPNMSESVLTSASGVHSAVELTLSLEIASMQLTRAFKVRSLKLKPASKVVSMRLVPSQDPEPAMNLEVAFELAKIELSDGAFATVRLAPSTEDKPALLSSPSFAVSGLDLVAGGGTAPVQLTPSNQEQNSVRLTAHFQIVAIEFTPLFQIATIVLKCISREARIQLPGSESTSIESLPIFQIESVQLDGSEIGIIQVVQQV